MVSVCMFSCPSSCPRVGGWEGVGSGISFALLQLVAGSVYLPLASLTTSVSFLMFVVPFLFGMSLLFRHVLPP